MKAISILIPTYNHVCTGLVEQLQLQAVQAGLDYEIIVADDGSTDQLTVEANRGINYIPQCRYLIQNKNVGRAAIRNVLAQASRLPHLLYIDSDMIIADSDFLRNYACTVENAVYDGGIIVRGDAQALKGNLRYLYEKSAEKAHVAEMRKRHPYQHIHTANLMVPRRVMMQCPFDERFRHYGFEDVLLGKSFQHQRIPVYHIHNPLSFEIFETNGAFVEKTEEGLRTLYEFRADLRGYSQLLTFTDYLQRRHLAPFVRLWHRLFAHCERSNLSGLSPLLPLLNLYKIGYYLGLKQEGLSKRD